jgi:ketosteroid isomerase-like protein
MRHAVLLSLVLLGCQPAAQTVIDPQAENQAARAGIEASNQKLSQAVAAGDVEGVRAVYTADAKVLSPNAPEISGGDAIVDWFSGLNSAGVDGLQLEIAEVEAHGGTAHEVGRFTLSVGNQVIDNGKYIVIWKRGEDGTWRLHRDIFNSDRPAPSAGGESQAGEN